MSDNLPPLDDEQRDVLTAAVDLVGRTGATDLEIGYVDGDPGGPPRWWAGDYLSDFFAPISTLMHDLRRAGLADLANRAGAGEFDGTAAEGAAWAASPEGRRALADFALTAPSGNRAQRRAARRDRR